MAGLASRNCEIYHVIEGLEWADTSDRISSLPQEWLRFLRTRKLGRKYKVTDARFTQGSATAR